MARPRQRRPVQADTDPVEKADFDVLDDLSRDVLEPQAGCEAGEVARRVLKEWGLLAAHSTQFPSVGVGRAAWHAPRADTLRSRSRSVNPPWRRNPAPPPPSAPAPCGGKRRSSRARPSSSARSPPPRTARGSQRRSPL